MQFTTLTFLALFGLIAAIYYTVPHKWRWVLLLAASYAFYATWRVDYVVVILVITLLTYFAALGMENSSSQSRRCLFLWIGLAVVFWRPDRF